LFSFSLESMERCRQVMLTMNGIIIWRMRDKNRIKRIQKRVRHLPCSRETVRNPSDPISWVNGIAKHFRNLHNRWLCECWVIQLYMNGKWRCIFTNVASSVRQRGIFRPRTPPHTRSSFFLPFFFHYSSNGLCHFVFFRIPFRIENCQSSTNIFMKI